MKTVTTYSLWGAAYARSCGVELVMTIPGYRSGFVLRDDDGKATAALVARRAGDPVVHGHALVESYRELVTLARTVANGSSPIHPMEQGAITT